MRQRIVKLAKVLLIMAGALIAAAIVFDAIVVFSERGIIHNRVEDLPSVDAVLVLGAAVYRNGQMSAIFNDRASVALEVYKSGKVKKILVSGDHSRGDYDEVNIAKRFFLKNGIPGEDIFVDYAGFDTYSSVYRAREIFQVRSMIVSTQNFHLPRALYLARQLGIEAHGISADLRLYDLGYYNVLRENAARVKAFWDIITNARPRYLGGIIPITGDGRASWD